MLPNDNSIGENFPATLANMSSRPRTPVVRYINPVRKNWVLFKWSGDLPPLHTAQIAYLDAFWAPLGFTGCALLQPQSPAIDKLSPHLCTNTDVLLNVLLRCRGGILLGSSEIIADTDMLVGATLATDDPRLYALARTGGYRGTR